MKKYNIRGILTGAFSLFFLLAATFTAAAADLTIELPSSMEVRDGGFYLGEYARIDGDQQLADRASMSFISPDKVFLERKDLIYSLGISGLAGKTISFKMPDRVKISPESTILRELRAMTGWKWRIQLEKPPEEFAGNFSLPPGTMPGAGNVSILFDDTAGRRVRRQIRLKWYQPLLYSTVNMMRGSSPDSSTLAFRIGTTQLHRLYVWDVSQIKGATLRQSIQAGRAILLADLEQVQVIKSGSIITLVAVINGLGVEAKGIALQHGGVGDIIKVKNLSSKKILTGRVIDMGRVEIN